MKVLKITHPKELWVLLKNREEIYENNHLINIFMDYTDLWINGCPCDEEENFKCMVDTFEEMMEDDNIINLLKNNLGYDDIGVILE